MNLEDKFMKYLYKNNTIDNAKRIAKDLTDIAIEYLREALLDTVQTANVEIKKLQDKLNNQVVVAEGEVSKEVDDIFINFPLADFVVGSYHLGHKNSSPFKKYEGKKIKIIVEESR